MKIERNGVNVELTQDEILESYYGMEVGVLLDRDDNEFEAYSINNERLPYGFYDENQYAFGKWDLEKEKRYALKYVEDGVDGTYAIISDQGAIGNIRVSEEGDIFEDLELDFNYFKDARDVVYSVAKIDGVIVEGFLERELETLNKEGYQYCAVATPSLAKIKQDYRELMELIKDVRTFEEAMAFQNKYNIEVEVNGKPCFLYSLDEVQELKEIEWIRYDHYGCLGYIYDRFDGKPMFDVYYGEYAEDLFINDKVIDDFTEENYAEMCEAVKKFKVGSLIDNAVERSEATKEETDFVKEDLEKE